MEITESANRLDVGVREKSRVAPRTEHLAAWSCHSLRQGTPRVEQAWGCRDWELSGDFLVEMPTRHQEDLVGRQLDAESLLTDMLGPSQKVDSI